MFPSKSDPINTKLDYLKGTVPVGTILDSVSTNAPDGWKLCDGSALLKSSYPSLYSYIGDRFSSKKFINGQPHKLQHDFNLQDNTVGTFTAYANSMNVARYLPTCFTTSKRLYVVGGDQLGSVEYAPINADGTLGAFVNDTALPTIMYNVASGFSTGKYVYIGTFNYSGNTFARAQINDDGSIGAWSMVAQGMPDAVYTTRFEIIGNKVYSFGGTNGAGTVISTCYVANINSDGTIGNFTDSGRNLPVALTRTNIFTTSNYVYSLGGVNNSTYVNTIYRAPIYSDGTIGAWTTYSTTLPITWAFFDIVATKKYVYAFGGHNGTASQAVVYQAQIFDNGDLGAWTALANLPTTRHALALAVTSSYIYIMGGHNGSVTISSVISVPFNGGKNDYTNNHSIGTTDSNYFGLPNIQEQTIGGTVCSKMIKVQ